MTRHSGAGDARYAGLEGDAASQLYHQLITADGATSDGREP